MNEDVVLTEDGFQKAKDELENLRQIEMPAVAERISRARDLGDLSENAEYHAAREEQGVIHGRILILEAMLKHAKVVKKTVSDVVAIGSNLLISVKGTEKEFSIVGANESDPANGKISSESPLAKALLGHKAGEVVVFQAPSGDVEYTILQVK